MNMIKSFTWIGEPGISGCLDILFVAVILYTLLIWSKKTRSASVLMGILIVSGVYLLARQTNMVLTSGLLEQFFKIILIALVIIFQEELRYFFEQIAVWSTGRRFGKKRPIVQFREEVDVLVRTLNDLARDRIGALIVIRGKDLVIRHLDGGIDADAKLSEALLKSIFDPHSIGHDGALFIKGNRVVKFSCHLPLSKNLKQVGQGGTRHSAALGLSELCDALCLVVSEERGTISIARYGQLRVVSDPVKLSTLIQDFYEEMNPRVKKTPWQGFLYKNYREKATSLILAVLIWIVLVYGNKQTYKTYLVPAEHEHLDPGYTVEAVVPNKAYVTLGGPRHAFYFLDASQIRLICKLDSAPGDQEVSVNPINLQLPAGVRAEVLSPDSIHFKVRRIPLPTEPKSNISPRDLKNLEGAVKAAAMADSKGEAEINLSVPPPAPPTVQLLEAQPIKQLEDANPEEVVKYIEKKTEQQDRSALAASRASAAAVPPVESPRRETSTASTSTEKH